MSVAKKSFLIILISIAIASFFWVRHLRRRLTAIQGAVITRNSDPRKQLPIADVEITASDGVSVVKSKSDASGLFTIKLRKPLLRGQIIALQFRHPNYDPLELSANTPGQIAVASLAPLFKAKPIADNLPKQTIGNVRVRYSIKTASVVICNARPTVNGEQQRHPRRSMPARATNFATLALPASRAPAHLLELMPRGWTTMAALYPSQGHPGPILQPFWLKPRSYTR